MLSSCQVRALRFLFGCYKFMYDVPLTWNPLTQELHIFPQKWKWVYWQIGTGFVFTLWFTCVYTLGTQPFFHRKEFGILPFCILTTGLCCFSTSLAVASGILALKKDGVYLKYFNQLVQLEANLYEEYQPALVNYNRKPTVLDIYFIVGQLANFIPYLITLTCMFWDLDGPYWVLEDIAPDPKYRSLNVILLLLGIRLFLLLPGFLETTRTLIYTGLLFLAFIHDFQQVLRILMRRIRYGGIFLQWYDRFYVICNIFSVAIRNSIFFACSVFYFLFIQTLWICIRGWGHLEVTVYAFFAVFAFFVVASTVIFLPLVAETGELIINLPKIKRKEAKENYCMKICTNNFVELLRASALKPFKFSYGSYYALGKEFSRNVFENVVQNLLSIILLIDMSGRRR